jgi:oxalate decarboxylase/phosphoglucose isomerase-like protein (cupin superfamily)
MENFCQIGKLEKKQGYDVCRGEKRQGKLRYDLTKILPNRQTLGHRHQPEFPELFEVLSGRAVFLTQGNGKTYAIEAKEKDRVVIMPGMSIRTINPSPDYELIISNWIDDEVKNDYNAFEEIPEPVKLKPKKLPAILENLDFLSHPEKYEKFLTLENLYSV